MYPMYHMLNSSQREKPYYDYPEAHEHEADAVAGGLVALLPASARVVNTSASDAKVAAERGEISLVSLPTRH